MNIIIQSPGFKASPSLEEFVKEKVNSLKNDRISKATVTLFTGPATEPNNNYCEIRLDMPGNDPFVKRSDAHFENAISECVDVLKKTLQQEKTKHIHSRQGSASAIQDAINQAETDQDPDLEDVIK